MAVLRRWPVFAKSLPARGVLMGLDIGERRIGVAFSDSGRKIANGHSVLPTEAFSRLGGKISQLAKEYEVEGFVVGLPKRLAGGEGSSAQRARSFAKNLAEISDLPIGFWDERFSSVAAERALLQADTARARRKQLVDKVAAAFMLQGALDQLSRTRIWQRDEPDSPCQAVCVQDSQLGYCLGCWRSEEEIVHWSEFTASQRQQILQQLPAREEEGKIRRSSRSSRRVKKSAAKAISS